jgi:hypothetical protein
MTSAAHLLLGEDLVPTVAIRMVAATTQMIAISPRMLVRLCEEVGSAERTWAWIAALASEIRRPIAVNMIVNDQGDSQTLLIGPQGWSDTRVQGWAAGLKDELEASFGPAKPPQWSRQERRARERREGKGS